MTATQNSYKKSSFGPAFLFLSKPRRKALADYYEFCRLMDDIADEPSENPLSQLDFWQQEITRLYNNQPQTDLGKRLQAHINQFHIPQDRFLLLIEGMRADLQGKKYASFEDLNWYLHRVAVVVGQATLDILGVQSPKADQLAWALGSAVQLTNIIRDVSDDARLQRVYLPCDIAAKEILLEKNAPILKTLLYQTAQKAHAKYKQAFALMNEFPRLKMLPCRIMGYVYLKNLAKIEVGGFCVTRPVKLTKREKLQAVSYGLFKTFF